MIKITKYIVLFLFCLTATLSAKVVDVLSPDGRTKASIEIDKKVTYSIFRNGDKILKESPLSLTVGGKVWGENKKCKKVSQRIVNEKVGILVPRKYKEAENHYNQLLLSYNDYEIEFRVYNEGVAYRFISTKANKGNVESELVKYNFAADYPSLTLMTKNLQNWFEENYTNKKINSLPKDSMSLTPVMVKVNNYRVLLGEANVYNYSGAYLKAVDNSFEAVFANFPKREEPFEGDNKRYVTERENYIVPACGKRTFPWRIAAIYDNDIDILNSELVYILSDSPDKGTDYSWVKPGKVLWDWWNNRNIYGVDFESGINTSTYLYLIDYAAKHNIEYILIDEGWSDRNDLLKLNPDVDMERICQYADEKGVGVQLWCKWLNVERQMEEAFAQFNKWNVKGVKIDFMDRNDANMVNFFEKVCISATKYKLLVNLHGSFPNVGFRHRFPNLMTREGVLGLEYNKWSDRATVEHDVIIPYLRMWVGPMDYTPGAMLNSFLGETFNFTQLEPMSQGTRSHQVAMYTIYESPLQMVSDSPNKYDENMESFEFIKQTPTVWDEIVPLEGRIGEYIVLARRSGDKWFIAGMNGNSPREIEIDLSFIGNKDIHVKTHIDGLNSFKQAKDYRVVDYKIKKGQKLKIKMSRGGGFSAIAEL